MKKKRSGGRAADPRWKQHTLHSARYFYTVMARKIRPQQQMITFLDGSQYEYIDKYTLQINGKTKWHGQDLVRVFSPLPGFKWTITSAKSFVSSIRKGDLPGFDFSVNSFHATGKSDSSPGRFCRTVNDWNWIDGELEEEARKRIRSKFEEDLEDYFAELKKTKGLFQERHFEWLVRRTIIPTESSDDIASLKIADKVKRIADSSVVRKETCRLAKFIGIKIPPHQRGKSGAASTQTRRKNSVVAKRR